MTVKQGQWSKPFMRASIFKIARGYLNKITPQWGLGRKKMKNDGLQGLLITFTYPFHKIIYH